ncbi:sensor histidine kinase [Natronomonas marina]|uniref:sensor histidine kinase n=1 Tax=Natronomonas marina TaxID=2961939 RepID=UPI0020C9C4B6|nr:sensor histidine kinase [Natronomonas marina]
MLVKIVGAQGISSAAGLLAISATVARRYDKPGAAWFSGYTALVGVGLGVLSVGVLTGFAPVTDFTGQVGQWLAFVWILPVGLWAMFALRYTGRPVSLTLKTSILVAFPLLVLIIQFILSGVSGVPTQAVGLLGITARYYALTLVVAGMVLVVRTTRRYDHTAVWQGVALAGAPAAMWLFWSSIPYIAQLGRTAGGAAYVLGSLGAVCGFGLAVFRLDAFDIAPTVGVVGERDIVEETDDLVLIADEEHRVVRANERMRIASDGTDPAAGTVTVEDMFGTDVDGLRAAETVTLSVAGVSAKYDAQVSTVVDRGDRHLGTVVSLREVTERELRKERLSVLNRVLRHNLRNQLDVLNAHLDAIDDDHADTAIETTDRIARMSDHARTIDQLLSESRENAPVDVAELLRATVATYDSSVTVEATESLVITTDGVALEAAIESAVDNAVMHATDVAVALQSTPDGCELQVIDDGPGIPESELSALETGSEAPLRHGTGLGLWQLTWATRTLGGEVSFDTSDGTTVTISVPDAPPTGE